MIPSGIQHDFENRGSEECGFISINAPAGSEQKMPDIVRWFSEHPSEKSQTSMSDPHAQRGVPNPRRLIDSLMSPNLKCLAANI